MPGKEDIQMKDTITISTGSAAGLILLALCERRRDLAEMKPTDAGYEVAKRELKQLSELDDLVLMDDWDAIESKLRGKE